ESNPDQRHDRSNVLPLAMEVALVGVATQVWVQAGELNPAEPQLAMRKRAVSPDSTMPWPELLVGVAWNVLEVRLSVVDPTLFTQIWLVSNTTSPGQVEPEPSLACCQPAGSGNTIIGAPPVSVAAARPPGIPYSPTVPIAELS